MASPDTDPALATARASVLAEIDAFGAADRASPPTLRPLTLNTQQPLYQVSAPLAAKLDARVQAGYRPEGDDYPTSKTWSRVVVPAIAVGVLDVPVVITSGILAAFHIHLAIWFFIASLAVLLGASAVAIGASIAPLRDPLRLTTTDRRELNQARSWQSRQSWTGPRSSTPEYRLVRVAHQTVERLAGSPAWGSRYLDEHRLRLNLVQELDGVDVQAAQLAGLRAAGGAESELNQAWSALLDRVTRLRHYADGVAALSGHVAQLDSAANVARLDAHLQQLAVGSALDEFAAEQVRSLSADLARLAASARATSYAPSPGNAT